MTPAIPRGLVAALATATLLAAIAAPATAVAADRVSITTPYPAVAVEPGSTVSFDLSVSATPADQVALAVTGLPQGWDAKLRGGGFVIDGVFANPSDTPEVTLDVDVPDTATEGTARLTVRATSGGAEDTLELELRVASQAGGSVELTSTQPALRDDAEATFPFTVELKNDTPQELTFTLTTTAPPGWDVTATPSGQTQAANVVVGAGATSNISVSVDPPDDAAAGQYPIRVDAVSGERTAGIDLSVEIVGAFELELTTPEGAPLSTSANAGATKDFQLVVRNTGTAPLQNVTVSATPPTGWEVEFDPAEGQVTEVGPNQQQTVTAKIRPSNEAIAGDYVVTFRASATDGGSDSADVRVTVDTALSWGLIGIALIILTLVGLGWIFQRFGRR